MRQLRLLRLVQNNLSALTACLKYYFAQAVWPSRRGELLSAEFSRGCQGLFIAHSKLGLARHRVEGLRKEVKR